MTTNTTAPAALFSAAELVEDLLGGLVADTEETIVEEVTVVAITPAQLAELADTLDAEEAPAVTDTTPALTLTHYARTCDLGGRGEQVYTFATEAEAVEFPARMAGLRGAELDVYGEVRKVETTYRVGDKVTVRAFGQPNRPGHVVKLGRTRVSVDFLRNQSGRRHVGQFGSTDVSHA